MTDSVTADSVTVRRQAVQAIVGAVCTALPFFLKFITPDQSKALAVIAGSITSAIAVWHGAKKQVH